MISYQLAQNGQIKVKLFRKMIGKIVPVDGGWQYVSAGGPRGEVFKTVAAVKKSLEADE